MPLITCPDCSAQISDAAPACPRCGRPAATTPWAQPAASPDLTRDAHGNWLPPGPNASTATATGAELGGSAVAVLGGLLLAASPLLPWATLGVLSASGLQKTGSEALSLSALGVLGAITPMIVLVTKRQRAGWSSILCGIVGFGLATMWLVAIQEGMPARGTLAPSVGIGLFVAYAGTLMLVIGASVAGAGKR